MEGVTCDCEDVSLASSEGLQTCRIRRKRLRNQEMTWVSLDADLLVGADVLNAHVQLMKGG